jgi:DNA polymerase-3 subunit alpha
MTMILLRSYSHHSLLSALPQISTLVKDAKAKGFTTIALTDDDSGSSWIEFYDTCIKEEVKPILGATLRIPNITREQSSFGSAKGFSKVALLATTEQGYRGLLELVSIARTEREQPSYHVVVKDIQERLEKFKDIKILITSDDHEFVQSIIYGKDSQAEKVLKKYIEQFGNENILVELRNKYFQEDVPSKKVNESIAKLCKKHEVRYYASPAPRYTVREDEEAFRVVLAIGKQRRLSDIQLQRDFSLPSVDELKEQFKDFPEALDMEKLEKEADLKILTNYDKNADDAFFPKFALPEGQNPSQRLTWESYIGLLVRYSPIEKTRSEWMKEYPYENLEKLKKFVLEQKPDPTKLKGYDEGYWDQMTMQDYVDRLEHELNIIITKGYAEYFLVFGDIMSFSRENGIVINTRGSAAGALVGYLNNINVLDPLQYNIPFERFLNPFRPSPPDIDGDFADDRRQEVIDYIVQKYGSDKVSQIITFGTMLPRAAVRDVGRVLGIPYKKCDRISKLIPNAPQGRKTSFAWAFDTSPELKEVYEKDADCQRIIDVAKKIEGNYRHASSHAAGVIISPTKLTDYAPLQWDSDHKMVVIQYDMKVSEKAGLIKLDILGITNLAILGNALELTEERRNVKIDLLNIDTHNQKAFELLSRGRTMGTFQLSGGGMTRWLMKLEPTKVEDLMAMVALYRPGPMASIPEYIERKKDPNKIKYIVPQMKDWMEASYGIFVYQEDLLMTAINLAGYDWGEADKIRKGVGKKIQSIIDEQHIRFVEGSVEHSGLTKEKAEEIWDQIVPFSAYGFNKAHSSSYGMVAYWTAYMKAEYTVEFMTAYMTAESNNLDKIANAIAECREMGLDVKPPDVNKSFGDFAIEDDNTIRYGLSSVKNLGSDVVKFIIKEREESGEYTSMEDFLDRVSSFQGLNKRSIEALILSGSLDILGEKAYEKAMG